MNTRNYSSGNIYGKLMLSGKSYIDKYYKNKVEVICDCGNIKWVYLCSLKNGKTKTCGCGMPIATGIRSLKHGLYKHKLYGVWEGIKRRCYALTSPSYNNYGGRGITMCDDWKNKPEIFIKWALDNWYKKGLSVERKDNNKGYCPENCIMATPSQQLRNKRTNNIITAFGETKCITDWANDSRCSISYQSIMRRININGWDSERAILTPRTNKKGEVI